VTGTNEGLMVLLQFRVPDRTVEWIYCQQGASHATETMPRRFTTILLLLTLLACGVGEMAHAAGREPAEPGNQGTAVSLTLGQSMVPLYGPWKFHVGDSPVEPGTNQPLWATPEFDDATWETVDLTPKGPLNPFRSSGYVSGWGRRAIRAIGAMPGIASG
jgi:hypothetical protein